MRIALFRTAALCLLLGLVVGSSARGQSHGALPQVAAAGRTPYLAVLVWHDVVPAKEVWFDTTLDTFHKQLEAIRQGGFHVIALDTLRSHLERGAPVPPKSIALTFDDNGTGIYRYAFPLLRQYKYPATLFVHTNFVGKTTTKHHNSWADLKDMERSGLIVVQSLTANHPPDLRVLSDADVAHELTLSRRSIRYHLGHDVYALVYPEDNYDERIERLAAENGYALGFIEDWGNAGDSSSLLEVHRYSVLTRFDQALSDVAANAAR